jgi:hypothetical protein
VGKAGGLTSLVDSRWSRLLDDIDAWWDAIECNKTNMVPVH